MLLVHVLAHAISLRTCICCRDAVVVDGGDGSALDTEGLSILYGSPVLRTSLTPFLDGDAAAAERVRRGLREAVNISWDDYQRSAKRDGPPDTSLQHIRNDNFFRFQKEQYGEKELHSNPKGWLASSAGQLLLPAFAAAAEHYLLQIAPGQSSRRLVSPDRLHVWASVHHKCSSHPRHVHPGSACESSDSVHGTLPAAGHQIDASLRGDRLESTAMDSRALDDPDR